MENKAPKISVLMSVYNGETYLKEAVQSILEQSFTDFELLIINDGSKDASEKIILSFNDKRIVYVKNETNLGLIASLNKGLQLCRGKYIARMDADDLAMSNRLAKQLAYLEKHEEVDVLATKLVLIDENGIEKGFWNDDFETTTAAEIRTYMPKLNCIGHPTVMMRASSIKSIGYNPKFKGSEDWGLWLSLLSENKVIAKLDEVLLRYRIHEQGTTVKANQENGSKRIIQFKLNYLLDKLLGLRLKGSDKKVMRYLLIDFLKYYFSPLYKFLIAYSGTNFQRYFKQRKAFNQLIKGFPKQSKALFFFPFCHLGGAEQVHTDIVKTAAFAKPIVFFTSQSATQTLLPEFQSVAQVLEIDQLLIWPFIKQRVKKQLLEIFANDSEIKLFSSNSRFYYELLNELPAKTQAYDLIHAFMHSHEDSAEKWSLPVAHKLNARIIINHKTGKDFEQQYLKNGLNSKLLERIHYISNFVETRPKAKKDFNSVLRLLYVGRGTAEKRVNILAQLAFEFQQKKLPVEFHFVGDVKNNIPSEFHTACIFHGEISDKEKLSQIYSSAHILAMASTREGFPMVIMEAMMHGTVPISTNVGGISQHVHSGKNGILINAIEPQDYSINFTRELLALINNRLKLEEMSDEAYYYASLHFAKKQFTESYTNLFKNGYTAVV